MKSRWFVKIAAIVCALCLAMGVMSQTVFARDDSQSQEEYLAELPQATFVVLGDESLAGGAETLEVTDNRQSAPLVMDEKEVGSCAIIGGEPYISVSELCAILGVDGQIIDNGAALSMAANGLMLTAQTGMPYFICNERYLYTENGIQNLNGKLALPLEDLVKCLGITVSWDRVQWRATIVDKSLSPMKPADEYYNEADVYWLSRFICAMASDQPLDARVAVGSVCVNRLHNAAFAGQKNIYEVIFAKNQFDVATNGMIYVTPDETSILAAKIALEGCDLADGAFYVTERDMGAGYECVASIGELNFYA